MSFYSLCSFIISWLNYHVTSFYKWVFPTCLNTISIKHVLQMDMQPFWNQSLEMTSWIGVLLPLLEITVFYFHPHLMRKLWPLFSLMWILPSLCMPLTCCLDYYNTVDFGLLLSFSWWGMQQSICLWVATAGNILYPCSIVKCNGAAL